MFSRPRPGIPNVHALALGVAKGYSPSRPAPGSSRGRAAIGLRGSLQVLSGTAAALPLCDGQWRAGCLYGACSHVGAEGKPGASQPAGRRPCRQVPCRPATRPTQGKLHPPVFRACLKTLRNAMSPRERRHKTQVLGRRDSPSQVLAKFLDVLAERAKRATAQDLLFF